MKKDQEHDKKVKTQPHGDFDSLNKTTKKSFAPSLIEMLKHKNEQVRIEAIRSLLNIGDRTVCHAFANSMNDDSYQVRLRAMRGLYKNMPVIWLLNILLKLWRIHIRR